MRVERIKLTNYCQHQDTEILFTGNVVGIVGRNGAGKSNLVAAIDRCVTGEFDGKKDRLITIGQTQGAIECQLKLRPDLSVTVTRSLKGSAASLTFSDGRDPVVGADAVNAKLLELLEVDKTTLKNIVFVAQDELGALLYSRDSVRERLAQQFFGIDRAVRIERILADKYNQTVVPELKETSAELQKAAGDRRVQLATLAIELSEKSESAGHLLEELMAANSEQSAYYATSIAAQAAAKEVHDLEATAMQLRESLANNAKESEGLDAQVIRQRLEEEHAKNTRWEQHLTAVRELQAAISALDAHTAIGEPCTQEFIDSLGVEIREAERAESGLEIRAELQKEVLYDLEHSMGLPVVCPTCFCNVPDNNGEAIRRQMDAHLDAAQKVSNLQSLRLRLKNWQQSYTRYHSDLRFLTANKVAAEERAKGLVDAQQGNVQLWQSSLEFVQNLTTSTESLRKQLTECEQKLAEKIEIAARHPVCPALPPGITSTLHLASEIRRITMCREEVEGLRIRQAVLESEATELDRRAVEAQAVEARIQVAMALKESLGNLRRTFHPDGAPRQLVSQRVERMQSKINEYLSVLGAEFTVRGTGGFNFEAVFPNKPSALKIVELSGGQRITLSLAFRFAACESFSSSAGLLVLDEPSVYLDTEAKEGLAQVFERLRGLAERMGMQFLVVTHERSLLDCFDQLIEVGAAS